MGENSCNEETFNLEVRKFLKKVGVTSLAAKSSARVARRTAKSGLLQGGERLHAEMTLSIPGARLTYRIEDDIALS